MRRRECLWLRLGGGVGVEAEGLTVVVVDVVDRTFDGARHGVRLRGDVLTRALPVEIPAFGSGKGTLCPEALETSSTETVLSCALLERGDASLEILHLIAHVAHVVGGLRASESKPGVGRIVEGLGRQALLCGWRRVLIGRAMVIEWVLLRLRVLLR